MILLALLHYGKNLRFFLCIPASAADAAAVNTNGIKKLLANDLITFFINGDPVLNNERRSLPRNLTDCIILDNWFFYSLISIDELFAKVLFFIVDFKILSCEFDSFTFKL